MNSFSLFDLTKSFYDKRQKELKDREIFNTILNIS